MHSIYYYYFYIAKIISLKVIEKYCSTFKLMDIMINETQLSFVFLVFL